MPTGTRADGTPNTYREDGTFLGFPNNYDPRQNSKYTPELAETFCGLIENGATLKKASEGIGVDHKTPQKWYRDYPEFATRYNLAREIQQEVWHNETIDIADGAELTGEDSQTQIKRDALRIDTRFKVLANMAPHKYGARTALTGADGGAIIIEGGLPREG